MYLLIPNVRYRFEDELGFFTGTKEFKSFGYGRGGVWERTLELFQNQDLYIQAFGGYGLGNPENQFLGTMVWFGYIGLIVFVLFMIIMTVSLFTKVLRLKHQNTSLSNLYVLFALAIIGGYWIAGLGNQFNLMITVQWILWTWTGIILNNSNAVHTDDR
jgi:O-antigen ligase